MVQYDPRLYWPNTRPSSVANLYNQDNTIGCTLDANISKRWSEGYFQEAQPTSIPNADYVWTTNNYFQNGGEKR